MDQKTLKPHLLKIEVPWCERCGRFMDVTVRHIQEEGCSMPVLELGVSCPGAGKRKKVGHKMRLSSSADDVAHGLAVRQSAVDELMAHLVRYVGMLHR